MKEYNVLYQVVTIHEAQVKAKNEVEAACKVIEVVGDSVLIESVWRLKPGWKKT